ncbi:hypothetical protein [Pseudomonas izuensis]|uniref:hypothetical protein n=1 Tax=Pseudomonas izuensis TaxID=2684212 RepID=UPI00135BF10C|nr:hypothetical protein [Pseudomonas izuensis]
MDPSTYDIYLANGNITVFLGDQGKEFKKDILNSSLLGELVSTSKTPNSREQLFSDYVTTVSKLGWVEKSRAFRHSDFSNISLLETVEAGIGTSLTKEAKQALLNAFLQLKKTPTQSPVLQHILDKLQVNAFTPSIDTGDVPSTKKPVATSIRLTIVCKNASIITLQVAFKTKAGISIDILDQPVLNSIKDGKSNMWLLVSTLDAREYDKVRATVLKKIGNRIHTDLLHVPVPTRLG